MSGLRSRREKVRDVLIGVVTLAALGVMVAWAFGLL